LVEIRQELLFSSVSISGQETAKMMAAAESLKEEYLTNAGLTVFTTLDTEDFQR
jgi:hypothetical protein